MLRLANFFATGFYSGYLPRVPGTWGSAVAAVLAFALVSVAPSLSSVDGAIFLAAAVTLAAVVAAHYVWSRKLYGPDAHDPQQIVIDEFAGYFVSIIGARPQALSFVLAFLFFRMFDISKPYPCRRLEKLSGGFGIVMDDIMAGIYACAAVNIVEALLF